MNIEQARFNMIEQQIRPANVLDPSVLNLLAVLKREDFVPAAHRALAFMDLEVPLPEGQCMLAPKIEARLLQELTLARHERVLEVGTGSGYMAALLAHKAQKVLSFELHAPLVALARENLKRADVMNAEVRQGDGSRGDTGQAPWDAIVLSGSVAQVPQQLLDQLKVGGRLIGIVGDQPVMRAVLITRTSERDWRRVELFDTVAPRLQGFAETPAFSF